VKNKAAAATASAKRGEKKAVKLKPKTAEQEVVMLGA